MGFMCSRYSNLLQLLFISFLLLLTTSAAFCGPKDRNLIEYSYGSYGDGSSEIGMPMLWPPLVKIYQDGRIIFYSKNDNKFYAGNIDSQRLERLKKKFANEEFLQKSRFIEMKGGLINIHGGLSYIRYLDGDNEVLISTEVSPRGGTWMRIINSVRNCLPDKRVVFYPEKIEVETWEDTSKLPSLTEPTAWPFGDKVRLSSKPKEIASTEIVRYLFDKLEGSFSFFTWDFKEEGKRYVMVLDKAPNWYKDGSLASALAQLKWEWQQQHKDKPKQQ